MSVVEAHIADAVRDALSELRVDAFYGLTDMRLSSEGLWCVRLKGSDGYPDLFVCIEGDVQHRETNVTRFVDKIAGELSV